MKYWVFIVKQQKTEDGFTSAEEILTQRVNDRFWGLGEKTPNRRLLQKGDKTVFYVAYPSATFASSATLGSDSFALSDEQKRNYGHGKAFLRTDYGVLLDDVRMWEMPRMMKDLLPGLKFIENKEYWGSYLQGGVRQIPEEDFRTITENRKPTPVETSKTEETIASENQFALEAHLEEFMNKNWERIKFGFNLAKYKVDDQDGRQFPAGPWSIDFLCVDGANGDFVVVELKRGQTSDASVGQVLRYMGWVRENLAKPGQNVRGIIIAKDVDEAMRYAIAGLKDVSVRTYTVDFHLSPF